MSLDFVGLDLIVEVFYIYLVEIEGRAVGAAIAASGVFVGEGSEK